jgi:hypothetical protein
MRRVTFLPAGSLSRDSALDRTTSNVQNYHGILPPYKGLGPPKRGRSPALNFRGYGLWRFRGPEADPDESSPEDGRTATVWSPPRMATRHRRSGPASCPLPSRRSTHPALQRFTLTRPIPRHQPAWAGPGCSSGCSMSTSSRSAVRWHLDDPRCHRRSLRHRQDPDPSPLARPGTAPIARAVIRPTAKGLIPGRDPLPAGSTPRADSLLCPALAREAKTPPDPPGSGPLGPRKGPEHPASWTRRIVIDNPQVHRYSSVEKGPLKFLARPLAATKW